MNQDCIIIEDFYPEEIRLGLVKILKESRDRKVRNWFNSTDQLPAELASAISGAEQKLNLHFNYILLKWYRLSDDSPSEAYQFHYDPQRLQSIPLVLITLSGTATLEYKDTEGRTHSVDCNQNQANILNSHLRHRVSPPTSSNGERLYCLLAFDTDYAAAR